MSGIISCPISVARVNEDVNAAAGAAINLEGPESPSFWPEEWNTTLLELIASISNNNAKKHTHDVTVRTVPRPASIFNALLIIGS